MTIYVTARHGRNYHTGDDPKLTPHGVWQSFVLGWACRKKQWQPTFLVSPTKRTKQTGRIVRLFFPETWLRAQYWQEHDELFVSHHAGDQMTDGLLEDVARLLKSQPGDVCLVTHHQLADGQLLGRLAQTLSLTGRVRVRGKHKPGGAHYLCTEEREARQLCGPAITDLRDDDSTAHSGS